MTDKPEAVALELMRCAKINLENLARHLPPAKLSPFYSIVEMQIDEAIAALEKP